MEISRRSFLKLTGGIGSGLALCDLEANTPDAQAADLKYKLKDAVEFTTACTFCSCGCGMIGYVKDGKLIHLEGDPDHIINEGSLCCKGASMSVLPNSDQRIRTPLYRAPGSSQWEPISWEAALAKLAAKIKQTRDRNWIEKEKDGEAENPVNRTDAISFLGGAQNTNEECYLMSKMSRLLGTAYVEHQARL